MTFIGALKDLWPRKSGYHRMTCPHCGCPAIVRSSRQMSALTRSVVYVCKNIECGHIFAANTEITYWHQRHNP